MHPACPNKKENHLQNSLLRRTQFWVRKSFSKPASLKRASLVLHSYPLYTEISYFFCISFLIGQTPTKMQQEPTNTLNVNSFADLWKLNLRYSSNLSARRHTTSATSTTKVAMFPSFTNIWSTHTSCRLFTGGSDQHSWLFSSMEFGSFWLMVFSLHLAPAPFLLLILTKRRYSDLAGRISFRGLSLWCLYDSELQSFLEDEGRAPLPFVLDCLEEDDETSHSTRRAFLASRLDLLARNGLQWRFGAEGVKPTMLL